MYQFENEPIYEPSIADEIKAEAAEKLFTAIDVSVRERFDKLATENEQLKDRIEKLFDEVSEYKSRQNDLDAREKELARKTKRMSLKDLMGQREIIMYAARLEYEVKEKCSLCDKNRRRYYKTPLGNNAYDDCECSVNIQSYEPSEQIAYEMASGSGSLLRMWYRPIRDSDSYSGGNFVKDEDVFSGGEYSDSNVYNLYFVNKEDCQKYCDWLNKEK